MGLNWDFAIKVVDSSPEGEKIVSAYTFIKTERDRRGIKRKKDDRARHVKHTVRDEAIGPPRFTAANYRQLVTQA